MPDTDDVNPDLSATEDQTKGWDIYYEPAPSYRSVHADGIVVAPSNEDAVSITFYSERIAIPKHVRVSRDPDDGLLVENFVSGKQGSIRYLESTIFLSRRTAAELVQWLENVNKFLSEGDQDDDSSSGDVAS